MQQRQEILCDVGKLLRSLLLVVLIYAGSSAVIVGVIFSFSSQEYYGCAIISAIIGAGLYVLISILMFARILHGDKFSTFDILLSDAFQPKEEK